MREHQRLKLVSVAFLVVLFGFVHQETTMSDCTNCWVEGCVNVESQCRDCEHYCSQCPFGTCQVEWEMCQASEVYCPGETHPIVDSCACREHDGSPPGS
jgi:hypothetical protein